MVDWSGDGSHALFSTDAPGRDTPKVIDVDLHSGTQTTVPIVNGRVEGYARPDGKALLVGTAGDADRPAWLKRIDLGGNQQLSYPMDKLGAAGKFTGHFLASPDGTQLVLGAANGLVVMSNDGVVGRQLPTPRPLTHCSPVRWWTSTVILARCAPDAFSTASQLWQVPLDGGAPTALTAVNSGQEDDPAFGGDLGDSDAWQLPSGTFLQSAGACGTMFLSRLTPDLHTTKVNVPGVQDSIVLVTGATADKLVLLAKVGCGDTTSLLTYDPAANTSTVLLGPPVNGGGVAEALLYPGQK